MRYLFNLSLCVVFVLTTTANLFSQETKLDLKIADLHLSGAVFESHTDLFSALPGLKNPQTDLERKAQQLRLNKETLHDIMSKRAETMTLTIPYEGQTITVELFQSSVFTNDFTVKTGIWETVPYTAGAYYQGIIQGVPHSLVAISFFDNEVIGILAHPEWGNLNLGRLDRPGNETNYTIFRENLLPPQPFGDCVVRGESHVKSPQNQAENLVAGCVRIFFEADYALFQNRGSVASTVNYISGFFNLVRTIYANEAVSIEISQVYVWTTPDSYSTSSSGTALDEFANFRTNFDGDLAHLVALGGNNLGGVAFLDVLCGTGSNYGYSNINSSYQMVYPAYSWTVNVVAHELGHNFSSDHTHWCGWPGGAIDNCGPTAGYPFETPPTCTTAPTPAAGGGTIMSYCHLIGTIGINFTNGFGLYPGNAIRNATTAALSSGCISSTCPTYACTAPISLSIVSTSTSGAQIIWNNTGATSYNLQYRLPQTSGWNTVSGITTPSYALNGLAAATVYEVQVQAVCGANPSAYSTGILFKTASSACAEPTNLTATTLSSTSVALNWTETGSATTWNVQYGATGFTLGAGTTVNVSAKPYTLSGLTTGAVYDFYVRATCGGTQGNSTWVGPRTFNTPFQNDLSAGAVEIFMNAACPGINVYSNEGATVSSGEFSPTTGNGGYWATSANNTVWFKFTAPASGSVKVTTDISPLGTLDDTQIALYSTPNPTSIAQHLVSNEDGGTLGNTYATLAYYSGLTAGQVYYVQVDGWQNDVGSFCIEVHETFELPSPSSCTSYTQSGVNASATKWYNIYTKPDAGNIGLPVAAVKSNSNLGTVTVQEIVNPPVPISGGGVYYMQRYYNFESSQNAAVAKQIRLFYSNNELSALRAATSQNGATADALNISHYDGTNENCTPADNGVNTYTVITAVTATDIGNSGYFFLEFQSPSFSEMGAIFGTASLPVELTAFTGSLEDDANALHWVTAAEKNVDQFIVERSADGIKDWEIVCRQAPSLATTNQRTYQCLDQKPYPRTYYRLVIRNLDGTRQYANIITLERTVPDGIMSIAPNPAQNTIYVAYNATKEQTIRMRMIGSDGRVVLDQNIDLVAGTNLLPFNVESLPAGLYYCVANGGKGLTFVKW